MHKVCKRIGNKDWVRAEASGCNGGVWVLWSREKINVQIVHVSKYFIHMVVDGGRDRSRSSLLCMPGQSLKRDLRLRQICS